MKTETRLPDGGDRFVWGAEFVPTAQKWDESQHPRDKKGQFTGSSLYVPDHDAPEAGEWDWTGVDRNAMGGPGPTWRRQHRALVKAALQSWVGDPGSFRIHVYDALEGAPVPGSGSGKHMRAEAEALLWEMTYNTIPTPVPLYRGSGPKGDRPGTSYSWSEDKKIAQIFAKRYGGVVETLPAGARGLRLRDYAGDHFGEKQWLIRAGNNPVQKWDESQHPRDKEGQFAYAGTTRQPGEEAESMEGGGPERKKWEDLNIAVMNADEAFFTAKEAHSPHATRVWEQFVKEMQPYNPEDRTQVAAIEARVFSDPEYVKSKGALEAAQKTRQEAETALKTQTPIMKIEVVTNLATAEAKKMGVRPEFIHVVDKEPREFTVGDKHFTEGGHFQPWDEAIEINVRNLSYGDAPVVRGMVSHELSHFVYHRVKAIADAEFEKYKAKAIDPHDSDQYTPWHTEHFERDPNRFGAYRAKATSQAVLAAEFPASMALSIMSGGPQYLFKGISNEMVNENGHSAYAKSYWSKDAIAARQHSYESAINETIAEVTRYLHHPRSWYEDHPVNLDSPWVKLTSAMHSYYRARQARIDAAKSVNR